MTNREQVEQRVIDILSGRLSATGDIKDHGPAPVMEKDAAGMHKSYWILSEQERAKGFIRPLRTTYVHVGSPGPQHVLRELTAEEAERYAKYNYVRYEAYPKGEGSVVGRFWTLAQLEKVDRGCRAKTTMNHAIAETYAREPIGFYGSTFCVRCGEHLPIGADGEFVWEDGQRVGT